MQHSNLWFALNCMLVTQCCVYCFILFFFFKQKTAYEMRISDWSSDVCSSDLAQRPDCMNTNLEYLTGGVVRRLGLTKRADRHAEGRVQLDQPVEVYQHPQQERIARFANPPQHRSFR